MEVIKSKFVRKGRAHVVIECFDKKHTMPMANHVWLKGNPSFGGIPKGYVVHHLDHDPLNDDISNLVIMYKMHHIAHHFKQQTCEVPIECNVALSNHEMGYDYPTRKPRAHKRPYRDEWYLSYYMTGGRNKRIYKINGRTFKTQKEVEKAINIIFPDNIWDATADPEVTQKNGVKTEIQS